MKEIDTSTSDLLEQLTHCQTFNLIYESAMEHAYEGIVITDHQGKILKLNKTYAQFLQVDEKEVIGKHVTEVIENTRMHIVAHTGQAELAQLQRIHGGDMMVHRIPIIRDGEVIAVVGKVLFQDINELHDLSRKVKQLNRELDYYKQELLKQMGVKYGFDDLVGNSRPFVEVKELAKKVARTDTTILISGESGTGKELFAHSIHRSSRRCSKPLVKVNCAAIPESLIESVLFGYMDGAFTGATPGGRKGKFEMAHQGTIFLDEIGELPLSMQAKLLRVLQEKEIEPVGSVYPVHVDVRVIAASNRDLEQMVQEGRFRKDLYYRLNVVNLYIPPLRERIEDIPHLVERFLEELSQEIGTIVHGISDEAMSYLKQYHWPGNVRELKNVLERSILLMDGRKIQVEHLPYHITKLKEQTERYTSLKMAVEQAERETIQHVLNITGNDRERAIELLGISRSGFYQKLKKYHIIG